MVFVWTLICFNFLLLFVFVYMRGFGFWSVKNLLMFLVIVKVKCVSGVLYFLTFSWVSWNHLSFGFCSFETFTISSVLFLTVLVEFMHQIISPFSVVLLGVEIFEVFMFLLPVRLLNMVSLSSLKCVVWSSSKELIVRKRLRFFPYFIDTCMDKLAFTNF